MIGANPRPGNTGVTPPLPGGPAGLEAGLASRFDWYELTADGLDDGRCAPALALATGGQMTPGKARNGYARCDDVTRDGELLARVFGGSAREGEVHIEITGAACDQLVPVVRRLWPEHRVSRADSSIDFRGDFDALDAQLVAFATARGLKFELLTNSDGGATRYVGGRQSDVRLLLYKKSEERIAAHPELADTVPAGIIRAELRVKPSRRDVRDRLGQLPPDDLWGFARWSSEYAAEVLALLPERTPTLFRRPSDWSRSLHWLGRQYGPIAQERAAQVGVAAARLEVLEALGLL